MWPFFASLSSTPALVTLNTPESLTLSPGLQEPHRSSAQEFWTPCLIQHLLQPHHLPVHEHGEPDGFKVLEFPDPPIQSKWDVNCLSIWQVTTSAKQLGHCIANQVLQGLMMGDALTNLPWMVPRIQLKDLVVDHPGPVHDHGEGIILPPISYWRR